jgi:hypothetical protein
MTIETPKIEWFNGLSPLVKCANCKFWSRDSNPRFNPESEFGSCHTRNEETTQDFYCAFFELNHQIHVG